MNRNWFWGLLVPVLGSSAALHAQSVKISTYTPCTVMMIPDDLVKDEPYGWWSAWHEPQKYGLQGNFTPYTYKKMAPGNYTFVVYNEQLARTDGSESDGVVIESVYIDKKTKLTYSFKRQDFTEWNCLSCPWLYVFDGKDYVRLEEVIKDVVGPAACTTTRHGIDARYVIDGKLRLRIQEEKEETSFLDFAELLVNGKAVRSLQIDARMERQDQNYLELKKGEFTDLEFEVGDLPQGGTRIEFGCRGYYEPDKAYLESVYKRYQYNK